MAKYDEREGNSCHIHMSLRGDDGAIVFDDGDGPTPLFEQFVAGVQATMCEFTLLYAPNINSYKRFQPGQLRADDDRMGLRQPHLLVARGRPRCRAAAGEPPARRRRQPVPRAGAMLAGGLHGIEHELRARAGVQGNAYDVRQAAVPTTLREAARDLFAASASPARRFGDDVVDHYVNAADVELTAFDAAVTDWERFRGFERM